MEDTNEPRELNIDDSYKAELRESEQLINQQNLTENEVKEAAAHLYRAIGIYVKAAVDILEKEKVLSLGERISVELPFSRETAHPDNNHPNKKVDRKLKFWLNKLFFFDSKQRKEILDFIKKDPYYDKNRGSNLNESKEYMKNSVQSIGGILETSKVYILPESAERFDYSLQGAGAFLKENKDSIALMITILTALVTAGWRWVSHWYNVGYLRYWNLSTDTIEPENSTSFLYMLVMALLVSLIIGLYVYVLALIWLIHINKIKDTGKRKFFAVFFLWFVPAIAWALIVIVAFGLYKKPSSWPFTIILCLIVQFFVWIIAEQLKEEMFLTEIQQFYVTSTEPKSTKVRGSNFIIVFAIIVLISVIGAVQLGEESGRQAAEGLQQAQIINYDKKKYMIITSDDSRIAVEAVTQKVDQEGNVYLEVDADDCLLLDSDEVKEIEVKNYSSIGKKEKEEKSGEAPNTKSVATVTETESIAE